MTLYTNARCDFAVLAPQGPPLQRGKTSSDAPRSIALLLLPLLGACTDLSPSSRASWSSDDLPELATQADVQGTQSASAPAASWRDAWPSSQGLWDQQDNPQSSAASQPTPHNPKSSEEPFHAKEGFYIGASVTYSSLDGDFDGETALVGSSFLILLPEVDPGIGGQFSAGYRFESNAVELNVMISTLDGVVHFPSGDATGDVDLLTIGFDWKHYFRTDERLQPYFLLGLNFEEVTVVDGAIDSGGMVGDGTFDGLGADLGGGLAYYFTPQFSLNLQGIYRLDYFFSADGPGGQSESISGDVNGSGWTFGLGAAFTF